MKLAEFFETYKESLNEKVLQEFRPEYDFNPSVYLPQIRMLKRAPFPSQIHPIAGLTKTLTSGGSRSAFLVGEMGVGKTLIALAVAYAGQFKKILILCPPHLVKKWKREVEQTIPQASASIVSSITDIDRVFCSLNSKIHFVIMSRERAKLGFRRKAVYVWQQKGDKYKYKALCCAQCGDQIVDSEGVPLGVEDLEKKKLKCTAKISDHKGERICGGPLWEADFNGPRRYPLADYIRKKYKKFFDLLILDEVHEYKARGSAQGYAAASLACTAKRILALTGTVFGGYSTSLFQLLYRFSQAIKGEYRHNDEIRFASRYGILERITQRPKDEFKEDGVTSKRRAYQTRVVEKPGVSPAIITELLDKTAFLRLSDVSDHLPSYDDLIEICPMDFDQREIYQTFERELKDALDDELRKGSKKLLGAYLQSLLAYPDTPWKKESIYRFENVCGSPKKILVAEAKALSEKKIYPKEKRLIDICLKEKALGRKVGVFVTHTGSRDITGRIKGVLEKSGLRVAVLKADTVIPEKREDWIKDKACEGVDVLICHPRLVQTGLDLLDFPTLIFYQIEYSVYTLRQASRRSWRIGQKKPVRVHYFVYKNTMQEKALTLIAKKTKSALAVEGELVEGGLSAFANEEDIFTELAKSFVKGNIVNDTAEALFRASREMHSDNERYIQEVEIRNIEKEISLSRVTTEKLEEFSFPEEGAFKQGFFNFLPN